MHEKGCAQGRILFMLSKSLDYPFHYIVYKVIIQDRAIVLFISAYTFIIIVTNIYC